MSDPRYLPNDKNGRLFHLIEECGELLAALGKAGRWGMDACNPELPYNQRESNAAWIKREIQDVRKAIDACELDIDSFNNEQS